MNKQKAYNTTNKLQVWNVEYFRFSLSDRYLILSSLEQKLEKIIIMIDKESQKEESFSLLSLSKLRDDLKRLIRLLKGEEK